MLRDKVKSYGGKAEIVVMGDESILVLERYSVEGMLDAARLDAARKVRDAMVKAVDDKFYLCVVTSDVKMLLNTLREIDDAALARIVGE